MKVFATLAVLVGVNAHAEAAEPRVALVLPLETQAFASDLAAAEAARDVVAAALSATGAFTLVDRTRLDAVLAEQRLGAALGGEGAARIGRLLEAEIAVAGAIARTESGLRVDLQALRVRDGVLLASVGLVGVDADLATVATDAAVGLAKDLVRDLPVPRVRGAEQPLASLHYLRGIGLHRAGLHPEAIGELLEARRRAFRFPEALLWSGRAYEASGLPHHARVAFEAFLDEVEEDHPLSAEARAALASLKALPAVPSHERSPGDVLLADGSPERRVEAIRALGDAGASAAPALEAAIEAAASVEEAREALSALAKASPDRLVLYLVRWGLTHPAREDVVARAITPERVGRLSRGVLAPHPGLRADALQLVDRVWVLREFPAGAASAPCAAEVRSVLLEAVASEDPGVSLDALQRIGSEAEAVAIVEPRLTSADWSPAYRAGVLGCIASKADVTAILPRLLEDADPALRRAARLALWQQQSPSAPMEREAMLAWDRRVAALWERLPGLAREILAKRRFPEEAHELNRLLGAPRPGDLELGRLLLESPHGSERAAGLCLLAGDPALREREAWDRIADRSADVREWALISIAEAAPDPLAAGRKLLAHWRALRAEKSWEFLSEENTIVSTLRRLAARSGWKGWIDGGTPPSAFEAVFAPR